MNTDIDNRQFYNDAAAFEESAEFDNGEEPVMDELTEEVNYSEEWDVEYEFEYPESLLLPLEKPKQKLLLPKPLTKPIPIYTPSFIVLCKPGVTKAPSPPVKPFEKPKVIVKIIPFPELPKVDPRARTLPCKFGSECRREKCNFAHNIQELVPTVCKKHPILCETCIFYHPASESVAQYGARVFAPRVPEPFHSLERTRMCKFGLKCRHAGCKFAHTAQELRVAPCMYGMECVNWRCPYLHPDENEQQMKDRLKNFRLADLSAALTQVGLQFREDSHLCKKFADGTLEESWTLETVVRRMCEMRYLFEYTDFPRFYPMVKDRMTFDQAEALVMRMRGGYPTSGWPWMMCDMEF